MNKVITILIVLLAYPANAFAMHYLVSAMQTMFAGLLIIPLALLIFIFSGAYSYYKQKLQDEGKPQMGVAGPLSLILLSPFLSGFEGDLTIVLALYAVWLGIKMVRIKRDAAGPYTRRAAPVAGVTLILITAFLATFPFVFGYGSYWARNARYILDEGFPGFSQYQTAYAESHDGRYRKTIQDVPGELRFTLDPDEKDASSNYSNSNSMIHTFNQFCDESVIRCSIAYGPNLKKYEIRLTPIKFLPWPYHYFDTPRAFYMNQTGVIRVEEINEPGQEASSNSKPFNGRML